MSMYGLVAGSDSNRQRLTDILKLDDYDTGRERDVYVRNLTEQDFDYKIPKDGTYIVLLTRNGGGNREDYQDSFDSLSTHPNYVADWDCDWDCTYAEICFSIPEEHQEEVMKMCVSKDPGQKFDDFIGAMKRAFAK